MKWQDKAKVMQLCAHLPKGNTIYKTIQKQFGRLNPNPLSRIKMQIEMSQWIYKQSMSIKGRTFFELGTGHKPIVPIGFFLLGAEKVITVDLNRRLDFTILKKSLLWLVENRTQIEFFYKNLADSATWNQRFAIVQKLHSQPKKFMIEANIQYLAPADAAKTKLPESSLDYHLSTTVLEHIPTEVIKNIFIEARRILKNDGAAIHFIDLSDHFQHQDPSINKINFLRYSEEKWLQIAGNHFAYCNRLRASDFSQIFKNLSFKILQEEIEIDKQSIADLQNGFLINKKFSSYSVNDICSTGMKLMLSKK